jgi:aldehyde:ferredoxin oxidoreductase
MDGVIQIKDAGHLWGLDTEQTQHKFDRRFGKLVIGPAGENLVRYACAVSGERVLGAAESGGHGFQELESYDCLRYHGDPVHDRAG